MNTKKWQPRPIRNADICPSGDVLVHFCLIQGRYRLPNWLVEPDLQFSPWRGGRCGMDQEAFWEHMQKTIRMLNLYRKGNAIVIRSGYIYLTERCRERAAEWLDRKCVTVVRENISPEFRIPWKQIENFRAGKGPKPNLNRLFPIRVTGQVFALPPNDPPPRPESAA